MQGIYSRTTSAVPQPSVFNFVGAPVLYHPPLILSTSTSNPPSEGGGLTDKDIDRDLRQERYPPTYVCVCAAHIQSFHAFLAEIFGETTPLPLAINVSLRLALVNKPMYEEMQASYQNFFTMFCFKLDLMAQIFLRSCCDAKSRENVNEECLTVQPFITAVMDFNFQFTLLEYLPVSPKLKHGNIISDIFSGREKADSDQEEKRIQKPNVKQIVDLQGK
jgi:hypothetical protein